MGFWPLLGKGYGFAVSWARPELCCPKLWNSGKKKKIGVNLKFNLGKPYWEDLVTGVEGALLRNVEPEIRVPGK
jgi:hypothetical protein